MLMPRGSPRQTLNLDHRLKTSLLVYAYVYLYVCLRFRETALYAKLSAAHMDLLAKDCQDEKRNREFSL